MTWWEIARAQAGVVSHRQLILGGLSSTTIGRMAHSGELSRVSRGIYRVGGAPDTWPARLFAACLATDGTLGHTTAGRLWAVRTEPDPDPLVHVIVPPGRHVAPRPGVRVHRCTLGPGEARLRSGLPVTSRRRTVLDLLATLPISEAFTLADRAVQRGWIDRDACERAVREKPGRPGNAQLRRLAVRLGDGAAAESERVLHRLLRRAGVRGWTPNFEVWAAGELVAVLDVAFVGARLAIEIDGMAYHVDVDRFQRDRSRQNVLVAGGWTVLRFTWADLVDRPGYVVAAIVRMTARAVG